MNTRQQEMLYLLGYDECQIIGAKLPSNVQVLRVLFYNMRKVKLQLTQSAYLVVKEVEVIWGKAQIPIRNVDKCVSKVKSLYNEWRNLQRNCKRRSAHQKQLETAFTDKFDDLFDIAHASALDMLKTEEDKLFLLNQRKKGRPGSIVGCDRGFLEKEKRKIILEDEEKRRIERCKARMHEELEPIADSSDDEIIGNITEESADVPSPSKAKKIKRSLQNFVTPKLVSVLDKCKISDRDAVRIIIATAEALKHDVNDLTISASSIRRCRKEFRAKIGHTIRETFVAKEVTAITVHWDGKILPSLTGTEHVDRLPVVISFNGSEQLLGIPAISSGTGKQQAIAVHDMLKEWDLVDKVEAVCCDTTASNMGRFQGACVCLERILDKDLLYLPCRHHIFEIILRTVFEAMLEFASEQWRIKQPRDDYKELIQLVIVFLGGTVPGFSFKMPGAFHHARWMAKAIYCLKIFLFRNEFGMTLCEENGIRDICIFVTTLYIKVWIQAPVAAEAPREDLNFLKSLYSYSTIDENVSSETLRKFCNHLWYLSPEAVGLAFFDPKIPYESKKNMVAALDLPNDSEIKKLSILPHTLSQYLDKNIDYFISQKTRNFFKRFSIPTDFLCKDPEEWNNDPSYIRGLNIVSTLHVVNDSAERAVKLMEDYNNVLSRNEEEKQLIMQVVTDYRKQYPDATKSSLTQTH